MSTKIINIALTFVIATYYHDWFSGRLMANGKPFNQNNLTASYNKGKLNSWVTVRNIRNGRSLRVKITDRNSSGTIDLSKKAFKYLDNIILGQIKVEVIQ